MIRVDSFPFNPTPLPLSVQDTLKTKVLTDVFPTLFVNSEFGSPAEISQDPAGQRLGKPRDPGDLLFRRLLHTLERPESPQERALTLWPDARNLT